MKVVVGLGNPGSQYAGTRHNVGWLVMDRIAERAGWTGKGRQRDASNVVDGPLPRPRPDARQAADVHERSGLAVRKVLAREHAPLADLLVVADDFALPFGKLRFREGGGAGRSQRPALDHRRARDREVQPAAGRHRRAGPRRRRPRPHDASRPTRQQRLDELLDAAADAVEAWAREGTNKAANRFNMFELRPADTTRLAAGGRGRRAARRRRHPPDAHGLAPHPARRSRTPEPCRHPRSAAVAAATAGSPSGSRPTSRPATRRRRPRPRSTSTSPRSTPRSRTPRRAAAEAAPRPAPRRARARPTSAAAEEAAAIGCPTCRRSRRCSPRPARSRALRERLGRRPSDDPRRTGRHVGLVAVPHGAKSYLAAALALAAAGERLVWIARDAEIGDRVAEELGAWLGDPAAVAILEPRTALAYERSELIADETAARVAALAAWRSGRARVLVASVQALLQHTIAPADLPDAPRELRLGARIHQDALLRELFDLGYVPVTEVAGRGEFARRGGIVDVFPPSLPLPIRIEFFGDEIDSLRVVRPDRPADRRHRSKRRCSCPRRSSCCRPAAAAAIRERLGRAAARLPERLAADLARFDAESPARPGRQRDARPRARAMAVGDAAEVWAAHLAPATGLDHIDPGTLLVLDEPGDIAEAAEFLWRQADERRARAGRGRRAAEGLAVDLPAAARLEEPARRPRGRSS